jgi:hypothetical protein
MNPPKEETDMRRVLMCIVFVILAGFAIPEAVMAQCKNCRVEEGCFACQGASVGSWQCEEFSCGLCAQSTDEEGHHDCEQSVPILVLNGRALDQPDPELEALGGDYTQFAALPLLATGVLGPRPTTIVRHACSGAIVTRRYARPAVEKIRAMLARITI